MESENYGLAFHDAQLCGENEKMKSTVNIHDRSKIVASEIHHHQSVCTF
jgi:hypothetical protein